MLVIAPYVTLELFYCGATCLGPAKIFLAIEVHDKHVRGLHKLFLDATGRNVDLVLMTNTGSSTGTCHLLQAQYQVGGRGGPFSYSPLDSMVDAYPA